MDWIAIISVPCRRLFWGNSMRVNACRRADQIPRKIGIMGIGVAALLQAGCAATPIPVEYSATSSMSATGSVVVGDFKYEPAIMGQVATNQLKN
ncbi:MAG: hypothetical protein ISP90_12380, partial [Nevskia sp.]|nr:hypothetical protein [Nevskia sp.]